MSCIYHTELNKYKKIFYCFLAFSLMLRVIWLHALVRPGADDFYYVTFLDEGFSDFVAKMVEHHQNLTGRSLVHIILCPLLRFDMQPFRIWNPCLIAILAGLITYISGVYKKNWLWGFVSALALFFLTGTSVLSDSVLWGAGSMNYLFPACMIVLYALFYSQNLTKQKGYWVCIIGFFAAATVEMCGILAIVTAIYFPLVYPEHAKRRRNFIIANFLVTLLGYLSIFTSSGLQTRLESNSFYAVNIWERIGSNIVFFSRKICDVRGLGVLVFLAAIVFMLYAYQKRNVLLFRLSSIASFLLLLSLGNMIYHVLAVCLVVFLFLALLITGSVIFYQNNDKIILFSTLCIFILLAVCTVSPVVGYRLLLPAAIFLIIICLRVALHINGLPLIRTAALLSLGAVYVLTALITNFSANAQVIDANAQTTKAFTGECLVLENVPNEMYGNANVPTEDNFGLYYASHLGADSVTTIRTEDRVKIPIYSRKPHSYTAVVREGVYYVPLRMVSDMTKAKITWRLASGEVTINKKKYRFTSGLSVVDINSFTTEKLSAPTRLIGGVLYIPLDDFNRLFHTDITT